MSLAACPHFLRQQSLRLVFGGTLCSTAFQHCHLPSDATREAQNIVHYLKRLTVGIGTAVSLFALWASPVSAQAAGTPRPAAPAEKTISGTYARFEAELAGLPAPTQAQLDAAVAYAEAHPMKGSLTLIPARVRSHRRE